MLTAAPPNEGVLWSYAVQLAGALRAVHTAGLALRPAAFLLSKVLLVAPSRIRLGAFQPGCQLTPSTKLHPGKAYGRSAPAEPKMLS